MLGIGLGINVVSNNYALPNGAEPLIFLDFKNGVYTVDGESVLLDDLVIEDPFSPGNWDSTTMVLAGIGLKPTGGSAFIIFAGDAATRVLAGSTTVTTLVGNAGIGGNAFYELSSDSFDVDFQSLSSFSSDALNVIKDDHHPNVSEVKLPAGTVGVALTFANGKIARSSDGRAILSINPADEDWDLFPPTRLGLGVPANMIVEQIGIYPAQPDADLPMLSAL